MLSDTEQIDAIHEYKEGRLSLEEIANLLDCTDLAYIRKWLDRVQVVYIKLGRSTWSKGLCEIVMPRQTDWGYKESQPNHDSVLLRLLQNHSTPEQIVRFRENPGSGKPVLGDDCVTCRAIYAELEVAKREFEERFRTEYGESPLEILKKAVCS